MNLISVLSILRSLSTRLRPPFEHAQKDTNFSLFKYNNELSAEIEKLEVQIAEYKEECPVEH